MEKIFSLHNSCVQKVENISVESRREGSMKVNCVNVCLVHVGCVQSTRHGTRENYDGSVCTDQHHVGRVDVLRSSTTVCTAQWC